MKTDAGKPFKQNGGATMARLIHWTVFLMLVTGSWSPAAAFSPEAQKKLDELRLRWPLAGEPGTPAPARADVPPVPKAADRSSRLLPEDAPSAAENALVQRTGRSSPTDSADRADPSPAEGPTGSVLGDPSPVRAPWEGFRADPACQPDEQTAAQESPPESPRWVTWAAQRGSLPARLTLARRFRATGNAVTAFAWASAGASGPDAQDPIVLAAASLRDGLSGKLSPEELQMGRELAERFLRESLEKQENPLFADALMAAPVSEVPPPYVPGEHLRVALARVREVLPMSMEFHPTIEVAKTETEKVDPSPVSEPPSSPAPQVALAPAEDDHATTGVVENGSKGPPPEGEPMAMAIPEAGSPPEVSPVEPGGEPETILAMSATAGGAFPVEVGSGLSESGNEGTPNPQAKEFDFKMAGDYRITVE